MYTNLLTICALHKMVYLCKADRKDKIVQQHAWFIYKNNVIFKTNYYYPIFNIINIINLIRVKNAEKYFFKYIKISRILTPLCRNITSLNTHLAKL